MDNRGGILAGLEQERWYSERVREGEMVYWLDLGSRGGILIGHVQEVW